MCNSFQEEGEKKDKIYGCAELNAAATAVVKNDSNHCESVAAKQTRMEPQL
jgi:hypothetical protein